MLIELFGGGNDMKRKVLITTGYYIPGVKGGGPIQSIKNLVDNLSDSYDFHIITSDRDLGDKKPFNNIKVDQWINVGNAKVYYTYESKLSWRKMAEIINTSNFDVLYLNSFFSYKFSIVPIFLSKLNKINFERIVIAPRGQFSAGALGFKGVKKNLYIMISKLFNLYKKVIWQSTTIIEKNDIENIFGKNLNIIIASNLTTNHQYKVYDKKIVKKRGELKIVYISRIHPMKNLYQVLEILSRLNNNIEFNIYGPIEDVAYWDKCKKIINEMHDNVMVHYHGLIPNSKVNEIYQENHIAILLTLGENFGHAISEAFIGGCPVIISDRTPWRELEKNEVGWDLPLNNSNAIIERILYFINLDNNEYNIMSKNAFEYGKMKTNPSKYINKYYDMFGLTSKIYKEKKEIQHESI